MRSHESSSQCLIKHTRPCVCEQAHKCASLLWIAPGLPEPVYSKMEVRPGDPVGAPLLFTFILQDDLETVGSWNKGFRVTTSLGNSFLQSPLDSPPHSLQERP
jgi:hypothetical protein